MARLMFIAPSAYTHGGVQTWLDYLVPGLVEQGHDVTVGLTQDRFHDPEKYCTAHPFRNVVRIGNPTGSQEGRIRSLCESIADFGPELVLSVNIADVYPAVGRMKRRGKPVRVAMTLHGIQADFIEDAARHGNVLDGIICSNRLACGLLLESGTHEDRIKYAPYGVERGKRIRRYEAATRPLRIAYVGRLEQLQKRVLDIPDVLGELDRSHFPYEMRVAGTGPLQRELADALQRQTEAGSARLLGALSPNRVEEDIYRWADVLLVTSNWETGPIVIWEAMTHGVAVATSAYVGSVAERSLRHRQNCLIFPVGDCFAAAAAIRELEDPELRKSLAGSGFRLVDEKYTRYTSIGAWASAIEQLMSVAVARGESNTLPEPAGRLDRLLGTSLAETARQLLGRRFIHRTPGGEWPHSHSNAITDEAFLAYAAQIERRSPGPQADGIEGSVV